jgi:hypothetical protein
MTALECTRRYRRRRAKDVACFGVEAPWNELASGLARLGLLLPPDIPHGFGRKLTHAERAKLERALNEFIWQDVCGLDPDDAA